MIFEQLAKLEPGWAGDDSIAPNPLIIGLVREFYAKVSIKPEVHADPHGNIELVWPHRHLYATITLTDVQYERLYPDSFPSHPPTSLCHTILTRLFSQVRQRLFYTDLEDETEKRFED